MKIILRGGPADGRKLEVPDDERTIEVPVRNDIRDSIHDPLWMPTLGAMRIVRYFRTAQERDGHVEFQIE